MRGRVLIFELLCVLTAPKPPLWKGRWHGAAVTKGLFGTHPQIGTHQCESTKSSPVAVGAGFYPARAVERRNFACAEAHTHAPVGADASVRPLGNCGFAATYRKTDVRRAGRCGHRPLQTWCIFASVRPILQVRSAGESAASTPYGDFCMAAFVVRFWWCVLRGRGRAPNLLVDCKRAASQNVQPFSSSVSLRLPPSPHGEGVFLRAPEKIRRQLPPDFFMFPFPAPAGRSAPAHRAHSKPPLRIPAAPRSKCGSPPRVHFSELLARMQ